MISASETTLCRCWALTRRDGIVLGFTDHDLPLSFDGITFRAESGMTAGAITQATGLSVDNSEAVGALSDDAIREDDIDAGRFDGAEVRTWIVDWTAPDNRSLQFRGTIGEIRRGSGAFQAELRGLTEALNQPQGRVYQRQCSAVLGDKDCGFDISTAGYTVELAVEAVADRRVFTFASLWLQDEGWFQRGAVTVISGQAKGLTSLIRSDVTLADGQRELSLWQQLPAEVSAGDILRITAGCDKRFDTCRFKFANQINFRGFPDIPGEDWLASTPLREATNTGGSRR